MGLARTEKKTHRKQDSRGLKKRLVLMGWKTGHPDLSRGQDGGEARKRWGWGKRMLFDWFRDENDFNTA